MAGDVWWWANDEKQKIDKQSLLLKKDPYAKDKRALLTSRKKLLSSAGWIIPGHGAIFRVGE